MFWNLQIELMFWEGAPLNLWLLAIALSAGYQGLLVLTPFRHIVGPHPCLPEVKCDHVTSLAKGSMSFLASAQFALLWRGSSLGWGEEASISWGPVRLKSQVFPLDWAEQTGLGEQVNAVNGHWEFRAVSTAGHSWSLVAVSCWEYSGWNGEWVSLH